MPGALLLLLLTQTPPPAVRSLWWLTERGAVPLVCAAAPKGPLVTGAACKALLGAAGRIAVEHGGPVGWRGWKRAAIDPWNGTEELVAKVTPVPKERQAGISALESGFLGDGPLSIGAHRLEPRGPQGGSKPFGGWLLVDERSTVVLRGSLAGVNLRIALALDVDGDGLPEVLIVERCVNEERLTVLDGATFAVRFSWGSCGI
jgi:hypothetical protein